MKITYDRYKELIDLKELGRMIEENETIIIVDENDKMKFSIYVPKKCLCWCHEAFECECKCRDKGF